MGDCYGGQNLTSSSSQVNYSPEVIVYVFLSALNILLSVVAFLGNTLILFAFRKVFSIHPPTKLLFKCLAFTDLSVGLIAQPLYAAYILLDDVVRISCTFRSISININNASSFILCGVSMFTSTAISVDRLFALVHGIRYRHVVTLKRVRAALACFWLIAIAGVFLNVFLGYSIAETAGIAFVILSVLISLISYMKIFFGLRQHQSQLRLSGDDARGQPKSAGLKLNVRKYKRTVSSIAWIQLALLACYLPYIISVIIIEAKGWNGKKKILSRSTATLVYLNSSLNPLFYVWKIKEVKRAVKVILRRIFCFSNSVIQIDVKDTTQNTNSNDGGTLSRFA